MDNVLKKLRSGDNKDVLVDLINDVDPDNPDDIDIPEKKNLFTDNVDVPDGAKSVRINGPRLHILYARIVNQLNSGQSPIIAVVGKEGLGKSMTALIIAKTLHDIGVLSGDFSPKDQTLYDVVEFLTKVRNSTREAIMIDEANVVVNINDYHTDMNRAVASSMRTQRKRENVYIFVAPELQKLDSRIRDKVDVIVDLKKNQFAQVNAYRFKHGKRESRGKDYKKIQYPAYIVPDIGDVGDNLKSEYEKVDNEFKGRHLDKLLKNVLKERIEELENERTAEI